MKCEFCGGDLSLEAESCPHCGQLNKHAQQHIKDMKRYHGEFESTKEGVYTATKKYTGVMVRAVIIAVLVVIIAILLFVYSNAFSFRGDIMRGIAERNVAEYSKIMDQYIEEEDFRALYLFCEENYIDCYDTGYDHYAPVVRASGSYVWFCESMMRLVNEDMDTESYSLESLCSNLNYFYDNADLSNYEYYRNADREENVMALDAMEREIKLMLQTYCNLTEEETEELKSMSEAKRTVLIEERLENDR